MNRLTRTFVKVALALSLVLIPAAADAAGNRPATAPGRHDAPALVTDAQGRRYLEAANGKPRTQIGADSVCCTKSGAGAAPNGDYAGHGTPYAHPQTYGGGPTLIDSFQPFLILWQPSGYSVPAGYTGLLSRYVNDEATAYGADEWSLGCLGEYASPPYQCGTFARVPKVTPANGGAVLIDTDPFPNDCSNAYFPVCVSNAAIIHELRTWGPAHGLDIATQQPALFLPPGMGYDVFLMQSCAYHGTDGNGLTYLTMGYDAVSHDLGNGTYGTCDTTSHPNGNDADATISNFSHEEAETMTDPQVGNGWVDRTDNQEVADACAWVFPPNVTFNQEFQVNPKGNTYGDTYYVQTEWSNLQEANYYAATGIHGFGCFNY